MTDRLYNILLNLPRVCGKRKHEQRPAFQPVRGLPSVLTGTEGSLAPDPPLSITTGTSGRESGRSLPGSQYSHIAITSTDRAL